MKIPRSFELYGRTIRVARDEFDSDTCGTWEQDRDLITLDSDLTPDLRAHTFLHECCHAWLDALGRDDLSKDERFIDQLAGLIHQMYKSSK